MAVIEHLRPQVLPYARSFWSGVGSTPVWLMTGNIPVLLLLVFLCANVALLMFARAATRDGAHRHGRRARCSVRSS